jgi:hypothetical protein
LKKIAVFQVRVAEGSNVGMTGADASQAVEIGLPRVVNIADSVDDAFDHTSKLRHGN